MSKRLLIFFLCFFFIAASAVAHPHIFLKNKIQIVFDQEGISGFKSFWYADDFSTAGLTDGYDENENEKLDDFEIKMFEDDSVSNLKKFNYFTYIKINGKAFEVKSVKDFNAKLINGKIVYSFFIPKRIKVIPQNTEVTISQYDSSYFSFISFSDVKPVTIINGGKFKPDFKIEENKNESYYLDMVHPIALILRFKK